MNNVQLNIYFELFPTLIFCFMIGSWQRELLYLLSSCCWNFSSKQTYYNNILKKIFEIIKNL